MPLRDSRPTPSRQSVGFWREDFAARSFTLEPRWRQDHGLDPQGAQTVQQWISQIHPRDRAALLDAERTLLSAAAGDIAVEYRLQSPDRGWFWVAHRGHVVDRSADGRPRSAAGVIVDIDREKKLRVTQHAIMAQRDVALWAADLGLYDWNLVVDSMRWLNDWATRHDLDPVAGHEASPRWLGFVHPDERGMLANALENFRTGQVAELRVEYRCRDRSGRWLWLADSARVVARDARGAPLRASGVRREMTDLMTLRNQVQSGTDHLRTATECSSDWIMLLDPAGICRFANKPVNGEAPQQMVGRTLAQLGPAHDRARMAAFFNRVMETGEPVDLNQVHFHPVQGERSFELRMRPVLQDGAVAAVVVNATEITQQRQLENALLEAAGREQARIGNDLHDGIGQELTGAVLMLQACLRDLTGSGSAQAGAVGEVVAQLNRTIRNTRALAHGLSPLAQEMHGLPGALDNMVTRLKGRAGPKLEFVNRLRQAPPTLGNAAHHLLQIAQEAVSNALKHAAATLVTVELGPADDGMYLSVRDNGRGFPDSNSVNHCLGLRLMRYRARLLAADLQVHSAIGQGTTITCRCPVNSMHVPAETGNAGETR